MTNETQTLAEISADAEKALYEQLGVAKTVRYLNQFQHRRGNFTVERDATLRGKSVEQLIDLCGETQP